MINSKIFQDGDKYYFVEVYENGEIVLKIKENGWGDIWSLAIKEMENY